MKKRKKRKSKGATTQVYPAEGAQVAFMSTPADVAFFGGAASGGKTFCCILEPLRHRMNRLFRAVVFRHTFAEMQGAGAIWEEAQTVYSNAGAKIRQAPHMDATFPRGMRVKFAHMQGNLTRVQGWQMDLVIFDELTHFSKHEFEYVAMSRLRSRSGVRPYVRATCNPDPDSWVANMIAWWIDQDTGFPIPERSGVLRWFVRDGDGFEWADTREELAERYPEDDPLSFTFIPATLWDNPFRDPTYEARLRKMSHALKMQLLYGNWAIREKVPHQVFRADPDRVEYDEPLMTVERPDLRERCHLYGAWDFGSGESFTVCLLALVELTDPVTIWVEHSLRWYRDTWREVAADTWQEMERYPLQGQHYGDPAGIGSSEERQGGWIAALDATGITIRPGRGMERPAGAGLRSRSSLRVNSTAWQEAAISVAQRMLDEGRLRVHRRCQYLWFCLNQWTRKVPPRIENIDDVDGDARPKKNKPSHGGDALLYLVSSVLWEVEQDREENRRESRHTPIADPHHIARKGLTDNLWT